MKVIAKKKIFLNSPLSDYTRRNKNWEGRFSFFFKLRKLAESLKGDKSQFVNKKGCQCKQKFYQKKSSGAVREVLKKNIIFATILFIKNSSNFG